MIPEKEKRKLKGAVFIEGLPGVGNIGKIVTELLITEYKAKKVASFPVEREPSIVLVQPNSLVRPPTITLYHFKKGKKFLLLTGEGEPEESHEFSRRIATLIDELSCEEVITIGGIGLQELTIKPSVYVAGNNQALIKKYAKLGANQRIYGVVGPIMGVTGLLLSLAKRPAVALLAESLTHPYYLGFPGAERVLKLLAKAHNLKADFSMLQHSINAMEEAFRGGVPSRQQDEMSYIG